MTRASFHNVWSVTRVRSLLSLLVLAASSTAAAQTVRSAPSDDPRPRVSLDLSGLQLAQLVPSISPNRYQGVGFGAAFSYERSAPLSQSAIRLGFTHATLGSPITQHGAPADNVSIISLALSHVRRVGRLSTQRVSSFVGARLEGLVDFDEHRYGPPFRGSDDAFGFAAITGAIAMHIDARAGRGRITEELGIPIVGLADFPYVNGKAERGLHLRPVTIAELQAFDERLSYHTAFTGGWGIDWSYHLSLLRNTRFESRRYARQGLSMSISAPVGGRRQ